MAYEPVKYDKEADALYVRFLDVPSARTTPVDDLRMIDYSVDGSIVGLEFLEASAGIDLSQMPLRYKTEKLIGDSGLPIRILAS